MRGARNMPCETVPGKRAPTVKMCESDENYVPLNDGYNWKGDPNATLSGQAVPQLPPGSPPAASRLRRRVRRRRRSRPPNTTRPPARTLDRTGSVYTQSNLARSATEEQTWQTMLLPPKGN